MKLKKIIFLLFIIAIVSACKHEIINPTGIQLSFKTDVLPIFTSNCTFSGCHNVASASDGYILTNYSNIIAKGIKPGDANDSKVYKVLLETDLSKRMPRPPYNALNATQISIIKNWINAGALNN
jgi:hypothetical protein